MSAGNADISWWSWPLQSLLVLCACVVLGGAALWVGTRFLGGSPKPTFWRSIWGILLITVSSCVLAGLYMESLRRVGPLNTANTLVCLLIFAVACTIIMKVFQLRLRSAILAFVPLILLYLVFVALLVAFEAGRR